MKTEGGFIVVLCCTLQEILNASEAEIVSVDEGVAHYVIIPHMCALTMINYL